MVLSSTPIRNVHNVHGIHWPCAVCYLHDHTLLAAFFLLAWKMHSGLILSDHSQTPLWPPLLLEMRSSFATITPHSAFLLLLSHPLRLLNVKSISESCPGLSSFDTWPVSVSDVNHFHSTFIECLLCAWQCPRHWPLGISKYVLMICKCVSNCLPEICLPEICTWNPNGLLRLNFSRTELITLLSRSIPLPVLANDTHSVAQAWKLESS